MPPAICVCNCSSYNGWSILPCCADAFDGLYKIKAPVLNCLSSQSGTPYHFINFLQQLAKINLYVWKYSLCWIWGQADPSHFLAAILSQNYSQELYNNGKKETLKLRVFAVWYPDTDWLRQQVQHRMLHQRLLAARLCCTQSIDSCIQTADG